MIRTVVVEDEPATRERYCDLVREYGEPFTVAGAFSTARETIAAWAELHPQLLFTDIRMPQMSGLELVEHLRADGWDGVAVVISGYGEFTLAQEALRAGVYDYLLKPVFPDDLSSLLVSIQRKVFGTAGSLAGRVLQQTDFDASPEFIRKAVEFAETHLEDHISLYEVADFACVSSTYLSAAFTRECGISFVDFLHRLRVEKAKELLGIPDLSLLDVAERSGLTDKSYLNRIFKRVTGTTPGHYRQGLLKGPLRTLDSEE